MVAIEHRQKSAIIATTDSTTAASTANNQLATSSPRRSSDIVNSNDIAELTSSTTDLASSTATTATTTTTTANSNIIAVKPKDSKDNEDIEQLNIESPSLKQKRLSKMSQSSSEASTVTAESAAATAAVVTSTKQQQQQNDENSPKQQQHQRAEPADTAAATISKSAVSQRNVDIKIGSKSNKDVDTTKELTKKVLKLDLTGQEIDEYSIKSPKSPIATRLPHQTSLTTVDVEDRKTLREALYHGIFHRHRRTIFAVGSFLRMLRSRNSSYNTIRSSSEGEDIDEAR